MTPFSFAANGTLAVGLLFVSAGPLDTPLAYIELVKQFGAISGLLWVVWRLGSKLVTSHVEQDEDAKQAQRRMTENFESLTKDVKGVVLENTRVLSSVATMLSRVEDAMRRNSRQHEKD